MSLDDDLRQSLPSKQMLRTLGESVQALQKSVGFEVLRDAKKLGFSQVVADSQRCFLRGVILDALPRIDVSQITGSMARELERERRSHEISSEWMVAEGERRWAPVQTRDAVYALHEEIEAARSDAQAARGEARAAARLNLYLTVAVLVLAVPGTVGAAIGLLSLL
jgi:hypothetical protein